MSAVVVTIRSKKTQTALNAILRSSGAHNQAVVLKNFIEALAVGAENGILEVNMDSVAGTGTFTVTAATSQTLTIAGTTLTGGTDYVISGLTATQIAANIVTAINASVNGKVNEVVATSAAAVVTVTARTPGTLGNLVTTTATGAVTAGAATLAGGTDGLLRVLKYGDTL